MGLSVTFVSGPRRSGKSAVIRTMIDRLWKQEPHYIRLAKTGGDKQPPKPRNKPPPNFGVATARWLEYEADHVFDVLPGALAIIHRRDDLDCGFCIYRGALIASWHKSRTIS